ncbi:unnamed protein product, partial [Callosobruchus maculatus]
FCTFVYFASNRCNKIWMLLYYMIVQGYFHFKCRCTMLTCI